MQGRISLLQHIYIWVAFCRLLSSARCGVHKPQRRPLSFLETQDCIRHRRIPPFFRRVTVLWGDSGDGGDSSFGIPPADCRNCSTPHPLHDGHVDDDGVFGIPPLARAVTVMPPFSLSEAVRRRIAGHSPALRESRGNVYHRLCRAKCSVLHPVTQSEKSE